MAEIPNNRLKAANKGKSFVPKEKDGGVKLTPEEKAAAREAKIAEQTEQLTQKCIEELQRYKGATIVVGCRYMLKESIANVTQIFMDNGWKVTRGCDEVERETVLKFTGA